MEDRFDLLAKALAGQLSRRAALRSAAGAAAGAVLSGIGLAGCDTDPTGPRASQSPEPQFNLSGGGGNLACAVFCARVAERVFNRCRADASLGRGLCTDCGANANLLCAGPSGQFLCCGPGLTCCSSGCADL